MDAREHIDEAERLLKRSEDGQGSTAVATLNATQAVAHAAIATALNTAPVVVTISAPRPAPTQAPKGYVCAGGCGHSINAHRGAGCDVMNCECPAPHGIIAPGVDVPDNISTITGG